MKNPQFIGKLLCRYSKGELTISEEAALNVWRKEFPRNEEFFQRETDPERIRQISMKIGKSREPVFQLIRDKLPGRRETKNTKRKIINFRFTPMTAAFFILLIGAGTYMFFRGRSVLPGSCQANLVSPDGIAQALDDFHRGLMNGLSGVKIRKDDQGNVICMTVSDSTASRNRYFTLSTPRGSYFAVLLADSTKVYMNAESSLKYPANFLQDTIRLFITGEVYFEVNRDVKHPLMVSFKPNAFQLSVSNGRFNLMNYADEPFKISLLSGSLQLQSDSAEKGSVLNLSRNENVVMNHGHVVVTPSPDANDIIAWKKGRILYKETPIQDILAAIGRWYDVDIVYPGKIPAARYHLDLSRDAELAEVLKVLQQQGAHISRTGRTIFVGP